MDKMVDMSENTLTGEMRMFCKTFCDGVVWCSSQDISRLLVESLSTVDDAVNDIIKAKDDMI
jgi:hypothetical protein